MPLQPYMPLAIPSTRGTFEGLRRHNVILDNLGVEFNTGCHQDDLADGRVHSPNRSHWRSASLPPQGLSELIMIMGRQSLQGTWKGAVSRGNRKSTVNLSDIGRDNVSSQDVEIKGMVPSLKVTYHIMLQHVYNCKISEGVNLRGIYIIAPI